MNHINKRKFWLPVILILALPLAAKGADVATFYGAVDFGGKAVTLPEGEYTTARLKENGIADKSISSLKVGDAYQVIVYKGDQFQGDSMVFTGGINGSAGNLKNDEVRHDLTAQGFIAENL